MFPSIRRSSQFPVFLFNPEWFHCLLLFTVSRIGNRENMLSVAFSFPGYRFPQWQNRCHSNFACSDVSLAQLNLRKAEGNMECIQDKDYNLRNMECIQDKDYNLLRNDKIPNLYERLFHERKHKSRYLERRIYKRPLKSEPFIENQSERTHQNYLYINLL